MLVRFRRGPARQTTLLQNNPVAEQHCCKTTRLQSNLADNSLAHSNAASFPLTRLRRFGSKRVNAYATTLLRFEIKQRSKIPIRIARSLGEALTAEFE